MANGVDDTWRVWCDLRRKEDELKWCGHHPGMGPQYDSMGRGADASRYHGWGYETMGRVNRVRQALRDSEDLAQTMIVRRLSGINLSTIWHILVSACEDIALIYGGSVLAGGLVGGVGGAFFGGIGAVPGAAAGAAAGSQVGGWVLAMLGLKSLVHGVANAIPEALSYYEKGFREAWGPTRHDRRHSMGASMRGNPSAAAFYLANGHVIMVTAILSVLVAYFTRGKGDKAVLLEEIRTSPRLGPKVATWVEQNEDKLRNQAALRPHSGGGMARDEPPLRSRAPSKEREPYRPRVMPQKKVPCFTTKGLPQGSVPEFDRQLAGQEHGVNKMTVDEYIKGRAAFEAGSSVRNPTVARNARADYMEALKNSLAEEYQLQGISPFEAEQKAFKEASERMKTLAALHNPDMVAGGKDVISDFGDRSINSRIGAQWNKGERLAELDRAANAIPEAMRGAMRMNAKLERCK